MKVSGIILIAELSEISTHVLLHKYNARQKLKQKILKEKIRCE